MCRCPSRNTLKGARRTSYGGDSDHAAVTLQTPHAFDSRRNYPLAMILHKIAVAPTDTQTSLVMTDLCQKDGGVFVIVPSGKSDGTSKGWNSCDAMADAMGPTFRTPSAPDDVTYLGTMIEQIMGDWPIDPANVWLLGQSAGAFMAHRLAAERSDLVTAIVTLSGCFPALDGSGYSLSSPVHVCDVHGDSDVVVKYTGDDGSDGTDYPEGAYPGAVTTAAIWASLNGVSGSLQAAYDSKDYDNGIAGSETSRQKYSGAPVGGEVELWTMTGSGHGPVLTSTTTWRDDVMRWLREHPR